jgi:hypothetical protein
MKKVLVSVFVAILLFLFWVFWLAFFSERPPLTIEPATLAGDGSTINYCDLPELDGSGKQAIDIPKGNTPGCGYSHFPLPILAECTEPLPDEAADIRGLWQAVEGKVGHVERIEQCGHRTVVTTSGIIHDLGPNSSAGVNSDDTEGSVAFMLGENEYCARTSASAVWSNKQLEFRAFGLGPIVVKRYRDSEQMVWEYIDGSTTRLNRICQLPAENKVPKPRGRRWNLFAG